MADIADPAARIRAALDRLAGDLPALGLAVSGGGDSVALMRIAADWAGPRRLAVATVDHGLRPESAAEAQAVAQAAAALGLPHEVLHWQRAPQTAGNLMAQARDARLHLLADWAARQGLPAVALGHTRDDQAETLLMRLLRGSGVDGLSGMAETRRAHGVIWLRPMLGTGRSELRGWLLAQGAAWIDDPSNDNADFDRIRIRQMLADLGEDAAARIALSAANLAEARDALATLAAHAVTGTTADRGSLTLPLAAFQDSPAETRHRLLVAASRWISGADYPPRRATARHAMQALAAGERVTLDGAILTPRGNALHIGREPAAALRAGPSPGPVWDRRWRITGLRAGQHVAALGQDPLGALDWRAAGLSRDDAAASPAIWQGATLVAAPLIAPHPPFHAAPLREIGDFHALIGPL